MLGVRVGGEKILYGHKTDNASVNTFQAFVHYTDVSERPVQFHELS